MSMTVRRLRGFLGYVRSMRVKKQPITVTKRCVKCDKDEPHRMRGDDPTKVRTSCVKCQAQVSAAWRATNWQRNKLRDTWRGMIDRCTNRRNMNWPNYGGRGVTVCARWRKSFAAFAEDVGEPPSPDHTLDRKRGERGYSKSNCRWATKAEQDRNRRTSHFVEAVDPTTGEVLKLLIMEWSVRAGTPRSTIYTRLRLGWTFQDAIYGRPKVDPTDFNFGANANANGENNGLGHAAHVVGHSEQPKDGSDPGGVRGHDEARGV